MPERSTETNTPDDGGHDLRVAAAPAGLLLTFRRPLVILAHIAAFAASLMFSFLVANNMQFRSEWLVKQYPFLLLLTLAVKLPVFGAFKQYRGWWRYVSISDLLGILRASLASTLLIVAIWFLVFLRISAIREALPSGITAVSQGGSSWPTSSGASCCRRACG